MDFELLVRLLRGRDTIDVVCPLCSANRKPIHRQLKVLRIWRMQHGASYHCAHCGASGSSRDGNGSFRQKPRPPRHEAVIGPDRQARVTQLWLEAGPPQGSWVEEYLHGRGLALPRDSSMIRCHPACPFPDRKRAPAMIVAWTSFAELVEGEREQPVALHRIRGRGHENKAMLGPVKRAAMMLTAPFLVQDELAVVEGFETGLAVVRRGRWPVWALGSAGAFTRFPIIERVKRLAIFADRDPTGLAAAQALAEKYRARGRRVSIKLPRKGDFADA